MAKGLADSAPVCSHQHLGEVHMKDLWPSVKLSEIAPITRRPIEVDASASYPELGIRSFGKGTFHKPALSGMNVGAKRLFRIEPGDLVFSNVFAWEGAVAVATNDDAERPATKAKCEVARRYDLAIAPGEGSRGSAG